MEIDARSDVMDSYTRVKAKTNLDSQPSGCRRSGGIRRLSRDPHVYHALSEFDCIRVTKSPTQLKKSHRARNGINHDHGQHRGFRRIQPTWSYTRVNRMNVWKGGTLCTTSTQCSQHKSSVHFRACYLISHLRPHSGCGFCGGGLFVGGRAEACTNPRALFKAFTTQCTAIPTTYPL